SELAVELGQESVVLEVDCYNLKTSLKSTDGSRSSISGFWRDIMELSRSFSSFKCVCVRRKANSVAHPCARMVSPTERSCFWLDVIPDWLIGLAAGDCIHASD
uniref:RNase H type-1 domain-containing protein n=1 Tax=Setaria italica TaxID=4555 RepID=K4AKD1_SETIT